MGKKAKRKAREKLIAKSNRFTHLQKSRELKMAGIDVYKPLVNKKGTDYSTEIPFEKSVPVGRFEAGEEETPDIDYFKSNISL
jgi:hypothetical protein